MRYKYECINKDCNNFKKEKTINKPVSECSTKEFCEDCNSELRRIFSLSGHQTFGDGYKG